MIPTYIKILILVIAATNSLVCQSSVAGEEVCQSCQACDDQIWVVSARDLGSGDCACPPNFSLEKWEHNQWLCSNLNNYQTLCSESIPTVLFIHGYQTDLSDAKRRGMQAYQNLFANSGYSGPIRFVIWAWRSERNRGRALRDYINKSRQAVNLGNVFAHSLNDLATDRTVVIGYSLGVQIAVSGLTQCCFYQGQPVQLAIIAAATDCDFATKTMMPIARQNIASTTVFVNTKDRAVRASNLICRFRRGPSYQRFNQFAIQNSSNLGQLNFVDLLCEASRSHSIARYTRLPTVQHAIQQLVLQSADCTQEPHWPLTQPYGCPCTDGNRCNCTLVETTNLAVAFADALEEPEPLTPQKPAKDD